MNPSAYWALSVAIILSVFFYCTTSYSSKEIAEIQKTNVEIQKTQQEAIKAGLVQDEKGHWVKPK